MKLETFEEPLLEFGDNTHICPRAGITKYGVYDVRFPTRRQQILIGGVGTSDDLGKLAHWIESCKVVIPGKSETNQPELFPSFCGFNKASGFRTELLISDDLTRSINLSEVREIINSVSRNERVDKAVDLFYRHVKFLAQNRLVDVIVCIVPDDLYSSITVEEIQPDEPTLREDEEEDHKDVIESNFRRALKARVMHLGKATQLIISASLDSNAPGRQDNATKAWNFTTALYYKANQTVPWKLVSNPNRPSVCFVGIGFFRSRDQKMLHTSLAQIFDELGNGVILRGTPVVLKKDRVPHLDANQAYELLQRALEEYNMALETSPARMVIHKSSSFNNDEMDGFKQVIKDARVNAVDFVNILDSNIRLFRDGIYPPYRGTHVELDTVTHLLYTRGSVEYYRTYTGKYIPQPLEIRIIDSDESPGQICKEILGLTKMNWNNTQFDQKYPITLGCARKVGQIMKYIPEGREPTNSLQLLYVIVEFQITMNANNVNISVPADDIGIVNTPIYPYIFSSAEKEAFINYYDVKPHGGGIGGRRMSRKPVPANVEDVLLSSSTTVRRYKELEAAKNQPEIANFVRERFRERYLDPALAASPESGFTLMAINCLMIETLVSFRRGWPNTRNLSEHAFCFFFDREDEFSAFHGHAQDFYVHVRCGILHQAETTGGWLIHLRKEQLFDADHKIIDALDFTNRMGTCLENYKHELEAASWEDEIWVNFRKKMKEIIKNCEPKKVPE